MFQSFQGPKCFFRDFPGVEIQGFKLQVLSSTFHDLYCTNLEIMTVNDFLLSTMPEYSYLCLFTGHCVSHMFKGKRIALKHFYILYSRLSDSPAMPIYLSFVFFAFLRSSRTRSSSWTNSTSSFAFCRTVHTPSTNEELKEV